MMHARRNVPDVMARVADDRALAMLRMRETMSSGDVGDHFGVTSSAVRVITQRIRDADVLECAEPKDDVLQHYRWVGVRSSA